MAQGTSTQDQATQDQATQEPTPCPARQDSAVRAATPEPVPRRRLRSVRSRRLVAAGGDDTGMATAEYALVTVAAAGFAGLMMVILRGPEVKALLLGIIRGALSV